MNTTASPGPHLRADEVDEGNVKSFKFSGEAKIEVWKVNENGQARPPIFSFFHEHV